ncbi:MAG TPA: VRR-NUC domain-containing protein [Candidatus Ozemobacteraceae bacterium]|nr:VRR-NUC domain-containing protein [Candidatus Ozemobacteraceae bacterium]
MDPAAPTDTSVGVLPVLPVGYYLEHFRAVLETVADRYGDLLTEQEQTFLRRFAELSPDAQKLYVRLTSRRGPLFRSDRLSYAEIGRIDAAARELSACELLAIDHDTWLEEAVALLTVPELKALLQQRNIRTAGLGRMELLACLSRDVAADVTRTLLHEKFHWYAPLCQEVLILFRLLFFGAPEPDLKAFVLSDLGRVQFEKVPLLSARRLFTSRTEIDRALLLHELKTRLYELLEDKANPDLPVQVEELIRKVPAADGHPLLLRWRRSCFEVAARFWEREGEPRKALTLYADPETHPARERRARLLLKAGNESEAQRVLAQILSEPRDPAEEEVAIALRGRFLEGRKRTARFNPEVEMLELPGPTGERIEARVLAALRTAGREGFEAENRFWNSLFGIIFWDIIFAPIPRAFGHPFQYGPTDLFTAEFYPARADLIQHRLSEMRSREWLMSRCEEICRTKRHIACALVDWEFVCSIDLPRVVGVVPSDHLGMICERLARNPGGFACGFPDLFLFADDQPGYLLLEVKSPGDRLQDNQRSWMRTFAAHQIPCRLLQVTYPADQVA